MHLGMSGSFRVLHGSDEKGPGKFHHARGKLSAHDHVVFHMSNGAIVTFNDPRRFGYMKLIARDALARDPMIELLGPEPLGNAFDGAMLAEACAAKKTSLKAALSDQRVVAGLGNIYVCEALHRAHLSPKRIASTIAIGRVRRTSARMRSPSRSARCSTMRSAPAARRCATIAAPTASSATSSTISGSTIARARSARRRAARARSSASCRGRGARSFVRCVRSDAPTLILRGERCERPGIGGIAFREADRLRARAFALLGEDELTPSHTPPAA